jgi:hypothetical protein
VRQPPESRRSLWLRVLALAAVALASVACTSGTETGSPSGGAELAIGALSSEPTAQGLLVDTAWVSLTRVTLVPCASDAARLSTYDLPADLLHQPPAHLSFESAVSDYCTVHLELGPSTTKNPAELSGLTALVTGTRSDDTPFEVWSTLTTSLDFTSPAGPLDAMRLFVGVNLDAWFADADVHGATTIGSGVALVDYLHNPDVLAAFDADVGLAFSLYVDANGDEQLTGDELTPVASATVP